MISVGGERITSNESYVIILLFQVTSKVMHYFLIYKKIFELLFLKFFPFIDWVRRVNMLL